MKKIYLNNLEMTLTERCNFQCAHCMRGTASNEDMSVETMRKVFNRLSLVGNLSVCGGEPFVDEALFETFVHELFRSLLPIMSLSIVTNGSNYSESIETLLNDVDEYIHVFFPEVDHACKVLLSKDRYHLEQLKAMRENKVYLENVTRLLNSKHFFDYKNLVYLFDAGQAKQLTGVEKVPLVSHQQYYYQTWGKIFQWPMLSVLTDGTVSECDGEFEVLRRDFNYGNVHNEDLEKIIKRKAIRSSKPVF